MPSILGGFALWMGKIAPGLVTIRLYVIAPAGANLRADCTNAGAGFPPKPLLYGNHARHGGKHVFFFFF